ncbi:MAG: hypothetical protein WBG02_12485 [Candidatus Acidiferrum sp.]
MNIKNNLCLYINYLEESGVIRVDAGLTDCDQSALFIGSVKKEMLADLTDLLKELEVDLRVEGGDPGLVPPSLPLACERTPQEMVHAMADEIRTLDETPLNILREEQVTEEELPSTRALSLRVISSSISVSEGLPRVQDWFKNHAKYN